MVEDSNLFVVSEAADGTQGIRRQRLGGSSEVSIPTSLKVVKIYDEMNRVLSGRVDFNTFINRVAESFRQKLLNDIYSLWSNATAADFGGTTFFPTAGAYDEDELLDLIGHVEAAANGRPATIIGTKKAVRNLDITPLGDLTREYLYGEKYGLGIVLAGGNAGIGRYDLA